MHIGSVGSTKTRPLSPSGEIRVWRTSPGNTFVCAQMKDRRTGKVSALVLL